jgi:cold shock CspA family protein/ribosome-associated translation inhibitor RaiA
MKLPMTVTFRGMSSSEWIEADIRKRAAKLDTYCRDIMSCHVVVEIPHRHHEAGNRFAVRIDLTVPDEEIAVTRGSNLHAATKDLDEQEWVKQFDVEGMRKDLRLVVKEAFDVARRRLQDHARRHRLDVKRHEASLHGRVNQWSAIDQFGTIEAADGHEVYFHQNSVLGSGLKRLSVGTDVEFVEERGDKGPQASTVKVLGTRAEHVAG